MNVIKIDEIYQMIIKTDMEDIQLKNNRLLTN